MRVKQVFNNSVVLGIDDAGAEFILLGSGLGFRTSPGDVVDPAEVQRTFVPEGIGSVERLAAMVEEISLDAITVSEEVLRAGQERLGPHVTQRVLIPLADHIGFALRRAGDGATIDYPLRSEVAYLYPAEFAFGHEALEIIELRTGVCLPAVEAVPIAMHFVNAQFGSEDMREYVRITAALQRILDLIREDFGLELPADSVDVGRFITHLRFLLVRARSVLAVPGPEVQEPDSVLEAVRAAKPRQYAAAARIAALLEADFAWSVDEQETLYLSLHVARLTAAVGGTLR